MRLEADFIGKLVDESFNTAIGYHPMRLDVTKLLASPLASFNTAIGYHPMRQDCSLHSRRGYEASIPQ